MHLIPDGTVTTPTGFMSGAASCGIKDGKALDLMVLHSSHDCTSAGMFTTNQVVAAAVVCNRHTLASNDTSIRAVVVNSGIANACTGELGLRNARDIQVIAGGLLDCTPDQVLALSTGVIGVQLPMEKLELGIRDAVSNLSPVGGEDAALAIMTTDTCPKHLAVQVPMLGGMITIGGMSKGSGMIHPDMATMLAVISTDAVIASDTLRTHLVTAVDHSFNRVSVDGDTSTNDTVLLLANGASGLEVRGSEFEADFGNALSYLCSELAEMIVRDGEGVTKFITVRVAGARTESDAHKIANSIATSPLVKTAFAGGDPNWGRILMAAGKAGILLDQHKLGLRIGRGESADLSLVSDGTPCDYSESDAKRIFGLPEFSVHLDVGLGEAESVVWTGDLTHDYVTINSDYRT